MDTFKWHKVDEVAAGKLTTLTNSPGVIYPIENAYLPEQLKQITGVSSYYATGYTHTEVNSSFGLVAGEFIVARSDSDLTKNYNYVFGVSPVGEVYFSGPYKGFGHHVMAGQPIEVSSLFGQTPYGYNNF